MKKEINQNLKRNRIFSILILLIGLLLVTYMIKVEDEPGALPLLLIVIGITWFTFNQFKIRKINS